MSEDWIEKALGKKRRQVHKTEEERREAVLESKRKYWRKRQAAQKAAKEGE